MKNKKKKFNTPIKIASSSEKIDLSYDKKRLVKEMKKVSKKIPANIEPLFHATDIKCLLREDISTKGLTSKQALKNAKRKKGKYFISPRTFGNDT